MFLNTFLEFWKHNTFNRWQRWLICCKANLWVWIFAEEYSSQRGSSSQMTFHYLVRQGKPRLRLWANTCDFRRTLLRLVFWRNILSGAALYILHTYMRIFLSHLLNMLVRSLWCADAFFSVWHTNAVYSQVELALLYTHPSRSSHKN